MITAIYSHRQPSNAMLNIIKTSVQGSEVISNIPLDIDHTQYKLDKKTKSKSKVWGETQNKTKLISTKDYPFNWMLEEAQPSAMISALAKDSDRILILFPDKAKIPTLYVFMALLFNDTVRVFRGTTHIRFEKDEIITPITEAQYNKLILPQLKPMPIPTDLISTPNGSLLRPYQQQMVNFAIDKEASGWFVDMGLGKTLAALALLNEWIECGDIDPTKPILIVAPIMVALDTWGREVSKWGYDWDVVINVRKTAKQRDNLLRDILLPQDKPTLFITNPHQLEAIKTYYFSRNIPLPFEVLIIDELSMFKAPTAKRSSVITYYRSTVKKFLGLTGTPSPNNLIDVWNQLKIINKNGTSWAGDTIYAFQDRYFDAIVRTPQGFVRKWRPKVGADDVIYRNLSKDVVSMQTEGLVELPDISYTNIMVDLPPTARTEYDKLAQTAKDDENFTGVTHVTDDGLEIYLPNSEVLQGKLVQVAGGALYTDLATHTYTTFHDEKLEALNDLIESATSPMIVFYYYQSDRDRIQKKYKNSIPELDSKDPNVQSVISKWNDGDIPVLLAHPASVGHGLNLQDGGHTAVWFTLPNWNNDYYQQANKRLHRSGQQHPVSIIHIIAKNTIDEIMLRSIRAKAKVNNSLMNALDTMERS